MFHIIRQWNEKNTISLNSSFAFFYVVVVANCIQTDTQLGLVNRSHFFRVFHSRHCWNLIWMWTLNVTFVCYCSCFYIISFVCIPFTMPLNWPFAAHTFGSDTNRCLVFFFVPSLVWIKFESGSKAFLIPPIYFPKSRLIIIIIVNDWLVDSFFSSVYVCV